MGALEIRSYHREKTGDQEAILPLVKRKSRYLISSKLENKKAENVNQALKEIMEANAKEEFRSITTDNGSEFSALPQLETSHRVWIYYTHAYSAWEKGTNQRHNRILREIYPKGKSFRWITPEERSLATQTLNQRPKRILGYQTAAEVREKAKRSGGRKK